MNKGFINSNKGKNTSFSAKFSETIFDEKNGFQK